MKDPKEVMVQIQENFIIKSSSIEEPKSYLGDNVNKYITAMDLMYGQWELRHMSPMP